MMNLPVFGLVLLSALGCVRSQCAPVPQTNCPTSPLCPNRQAIQCVIDRAVANGFLSSSDLILNSGFSEFGALRIALTNLIAAANAATESVEGIEEAVTNINGQLGQVLHSSCYIINTPALASLRRFATDDMLDLVFGLYRAGGGSHDFCPNRVSVQASLDQALTAGSINVLAMLNNPSNEIAFAGTLQIQGILLEELQKGGITEVAKLTGLMSEIQDFFIDDLEERCFILIVGRPIEDLILESFFAATEGLVADYRAAGGATPLHCPNRDAILAAINLPTFNSFSLMSTFSTEFGIINSRRTTLEAQAASNTVVDAIIGILRQSLAIKTDFEAAIMSFCNIPYAGAVQDVIDADFAAKTRELEVDLIAAGNNGGVPIICPNREALRQMFLGTAPIDPYALINNGAFREFSLLRNSLRLLQTGIPFGVPDRKTLVERVAGLESGFFSIVTGTCAIPVASSVRRPIEAAFDARIEVFCNLFP